MVHAGRCPLPCHHGVPSVALSPPWSLAQASWHPNATGHGARGNVDRLGVQKQLNSWPKWPRSSLNRVPMPRDKPASCLHSAPSAWGCPPGCRRVWGALLSRLAASLCSGRSGGWRRQQGQLGGEERAPWPVCSQWELGESQKGREGARPVRRSLEARDSMAGSLHSGKGLSQWSCAMHRRPGSVGFAESADLLSPRASLGGDWKELAAWPWALLPHLPFPGHRSHQIRRPCAWDGLAGTLQAGLPAPWGRRGNVSPSPSALVQGPSSGLPITSSKTLGGISPLGAGAPTCLQSLCPQSSHPL